LRITERERERRSAGAFSDYGAHSTRTPTRKLSAAVRPSAARKGDSEVSPDNDTTQHAHAHNKPSAVEKGYSSDCNATQHDTKRERGSL
jgi:hypothetical protein